ncbi:unnamed protein product [Parnassius apollo]|uniref:(apollo) hypothetical protein n=1 Tax=Parnassius apollo TaxID=110799 RepID=A0A8S3W9Q5_PARAO|nr:unnamed protein product [Parnassius apollo]
MDDACKCNKKCGEKISQVSRQAIFDNFGNLIITRISGNISYAMLIIPLLVPVQLPKQLQHMKYQVQYRAPSPPPPGVTRTPEEIEAEIKKVEAEYEKLALVFIEYV